MTSNYYAEIAFYAYILILIPLYRVTAPMMSARTRGMFISIVSSLIYIFSGFPLYWLIFYATSSLAVALYGYVIFKVKNDKSNYGGILLGVAIITISLLLMFLNYKYYFGMIFFKLTVQEYLSSLSWIGISYFVFRSIDVLIHANSSLTNKYSLSCSFSYLFFFPTFLMGPINRYRLFVEDLAASQKTLTFLDVRDIAMRIGIGVIKALYIAPLFLQHSLFAIKSDAPSMTLGCVLLGCYATYLYIYIEFSGYSDIAISVARLFNISVPENFNMPFLAYNIKEFWNRWHISFAHWCRDNIFFVLLRGLTLHFRAIPPFASQIISIFITFLFMGAWHGDSLNWILYGVYHAMGMSLWYGYTKIFNQYAPDFYEKLSTHVFYKTFSALTTFHFVVLGLLMTRDISFLIKLFR